MKGDSLKDLVEMERHLKADNFIPKSSIYEVFAFAQHHSQRFKTREFSWMICFIQKSLILIFLNICTETKTACQLHQFKGGGQRHFLFLITRSVKEKWLHNGWWCLFVRNHRIRSLYKWEAFHKNCSFIDLINNILENLKINTLKI